MVYTKEDRLIAFEWEGVPQIELMKELLQKAIQFAEKNSVVRELHYMTKVKGTLTMISNWGVSVYEPAMRKAGRLKLAIVYPADIFTKYAINVMQTLLGGDRLRSFGNAGVAKNWLTQAIE